MIIWLYDYLYIYIYGYMIIMFVFLCLMLFFRRAIMCCMCCCMFAVSCLWKEQVSLYIWFLPCFMFSIVLHVFICVSGDSIVFHVFFRHIIICFVCPLLFVWCIIKRKKQYLLLYDVYSLFVLCIVHSRSSAQMLCDICLRLLSEFGCADLCIWTSIQRSDATYLYVIKRHMWIYIYIYICIHIHVYI